MIRVQVDILFLTEDSMNPYKGKHTWNKPVISLFINDVTGFLFCTIPVMRASLCNKNKNRRKEK